MAKKREKRMGNGKDKKLEKEIAAMERAMRKADTEGQCLLLIEEVLPQIQEIDERLSRKHGRKMMENVTFRVKSPESIVKKLHRKRRAVSLASAVGTLRDMAGIRIVCSFQDDVYRVADALGKLPGYMLVKEKNYIARPKASGYRSIHLILKPVKPADEEGKKAAGERVACVEIQIRSVAMNYWAILDYQLCYKNEKKGAEKIRWELKEYAVEIAKIDRKMLKLRREIEKI